MNSTSEQGLIGTRYRNMKVLLGPKYALHLCLQMYTHICTCMCVYVYVYIYVYTYIYIYVFAYIYMYMCVCVCIYGPPPLR